MPSDLARIAAGLPIASLWPLTVPYVTRSRWRVTGSAAISALYILAPQIPSASSLFLLVVATCTPLALWSPIGDTEPTDDSWKDQLGACGPVLAALLLGVMGAATVDFKQGWSAFEEVVSSNRVALAATGLIGAVFIGGSIVAWILKPFSRALKSDRSLELQGLAYSGLYIGWFERAVLFAFLIGGVPEAAAIAFAAKSFAARFPTLNESHEGFPEYFWVGSLASLTVAVAVAAATRAALGIGPF